MAIKPVVTCDRCGKEPAGTYYLTLSDGVCWNVDLCELHARKVEEFRTMGIGREYVEQKGKRNTFSKTTPHDLLKGHTRP